MLIGIGSDQKGFKLKQETIDYLQVYGFEVKDFGPLKDDERCDYPKSAYLVSKAVGTSKVSRGILISSNGIDMSIVANKIKGVRAARCVSWRDAVESRRQCATNVLCVGDDADIWEIIDSWLSEQFDESNSDQLSMIEEIEGR
jgi:ribose 5-phosphate isomerase B